MSKSQSAIKHLWYTLGPATLNHLCDSIQAGATGVRLTFSFGTKEDQDERAINIRAAQKKVAREQFNIIADLAGEKIRLREFEGAESIPINAGDKIIIKDVPKSIPNVNEPIIGVDKAFLDATEIGSKITIGDGSASLRVKSKTEEELEAVALRSGDIEGRRGIVVEEGLASPASMTKKDWEDLEHVLGSKLYDSIMLSFVSNLKICREVREKVDASLNKKSLYGKIETPVGVENLESVIGYFDGIIIGRGDLAVYGDWRKLYQYSMKIVEICQRHNTPWIVATQIVEGVEKFATPTRAEICDMYAWKEKGAAGVLLSRETAFGFRPIDAIRFTAEMLTGVVGKEE